MCDGRCATCRWWERVSLGHGGTGMQRYADYGECQLTTEDDDGQRRHPDSLAWATGSSYEEVTGMVLRTMPDFGCVQWDKAEVTP